MKIAIIDDQLCDRQQLSEFVLRYGEAHNIAMDITTFSSGEMFLPQFSGGTFDLIFLDIFMQELNGMEIAHKVRELDTDCLLVFATTTASYAVESFRVRAFDYLLKPYNYAQFAQVMKLVDQALGCQSRFIEVKESRQRIKIFLKDIIYTDYDNHYIQIHTKLRIVRTYMPFADFAPLLLDYPQFIHCYRNCIINMDYVDKMEVQDAVMQNGAYIPLKQDRRKEIRQTYADYVFARIAEE